MFDMSQPFNGRILINESECGFRSRTRQAGRPAAQQAQAYLPCLGFITVINSERDQIVFHGLQNTTLKMTDDFIVFCLIQFRNICNSNFSLKSLTLKYIIYLNLSYKNRGYKRAIEFNSNLEKKPTF